MQQPSAQRTVVLVGALAGTQAALAAALPPGLDFTPVADLAAASAILRGQAAPPLVLFEFGDGAGDWCRAVRLDPATAAGVLLAVGAGADPAQSMLEADVDDILAAPLNAQIAALRIRTHLRLTQQDSELEWRVRERTRELSEAKLALEQQSSARSSAMARADFLAHYDPLTSLPNRRHMMERVAEEHARISGQGGSFALLVLNLDRFRVVNNALGQPVGDHLLVACAARIEACLRRCDILGRLGADEFVVLLLGDGFDWSNRAEQAEAVGRRVLDAIAARFDLEGHRIELTASAGVAIHPGDGDTPEELYRRATAALHHAKSSGRGMLEGYRPEFDVGASRQFRQEKLIRRALDEGALQPYFQPKVEIDSGRIVGAEALVRWPQPDGVVMGAGQIIALATEAGLLDAVEDEVLRKVFEQAAAWAPRLAAGLRIAVNLSPPRFRRAELPAQIARLLERAGCAAASIEIEITESALIDSVEDAAKRMRALREMGLAISLDDFGTGYSSLARLKQLPLDTLKIDQHFVREIDRDPRDAAILQAIVTLAASMGLATVVEGIERPAQLAAVRQQGCRVAQGFLFGAAMPAVEFVALLAGGVLAPGRRG